MSASQGTSTPERRRRRTRPSPRRAQRVLLASLVTAFVLLCVWIGTSPASSTPPGSRQIAAALAYARCMRSHGVTNFPDPDPDGQFPSFHPDVSNQRLAAAQHSCRHLLSPSGGGGTETRGDQLKIAFLLKVARCMRTHGFPTYPDPVPGSASNQGSGTRFRGTGIDVRSERFQKEENACEKQARKLLHLP
jgi:hypothetical protein